MAKTALAKVKASQKAPSVPVNDDPIAELRRLVHEHMALTKRAVQVSNMSCDRKMADGTVALCRLPGESIGEFQALKESCIKRAASLETPMRRELRRLEVWNLFLDKVYGNGPKISGPLVIHCDVTKTEKLSSLRRYCGLDKTVRATAGQVLQENRHIKMRLFQMFSAAVKCGAKSVAGAPFGKRNKYIDIALDALHRQKSDPTFEPIKGTIVRPNGDKWNASRVLAKCRAKALDVFVEDFYTLSRALLGLPVWPSWYAAKLGYAHGGSRIDVAAMGPKLLTVDEALAVIGDVGAYPALGPWSFRVKTPKGGAGPDPEEMLFEDDAEPIAAE